MLKMKSPVQMYSPGVKTFSSGFGSRPLKAVNYIYPRAEPIDNLGMFYAKDIRPSRSFRPLCIMLWGRRGEGKTLGMTAIANAMRETYLSHGVRYHKTLRPWGRRIGSNYHIDFADFNNPMLVDMIVDFPPWARRMLFCVDEILAFFPNRRSLARPNLNFSTFLQQIRKLETELIFTTQFPQNMDGQILQQIDLFGTPKRINKGRDLKILLWDWWGQFTGNFASKKWPPNPAENPPDYQLTIYDIERFYGAYPTEEVVAPMWSASREDMVARSWGTELHKVSEVDAAASEKATAERYSRIAARGGLIDSLESYMDSLEDRVALSQLVPDVRMLTRGKENISTQAVLGEWMEQHGWEVGMMGRTMMGIRLGTDE